MSRTARLSLLIAAGFMIMAGCGGDDGGVTGTRVVRGNGVILSETRTIGGFTSIIHAGEGSVHIAVGAAEALRIEADGNLLDYIVTQVQGGVLQIHTESNVDIVPTQSIEYFVTVVDLQSVMLSGVGDIDVPALTANQASLALSGVGEIEWSGLDAVELEVLLSGVGNVRCSGQTDTQTVTVSGVGTYDAPNLASRVATVTVGDQGSATVNVSERLTATVTGNGSVSYVDSSGGGLIVDCTPAAGCSATP